MIKFLILGVEIEMTEEREVDRSRALSDLEETLTIDSQCRYHGIKSDLHTLPIRRGLDEVWRNDPPIPTIYGAKGIPYDDNDDYRIYSQVRGTTTTTFMSGPESNAEFRDRFYQAYPYFQGLDFTGILIAGGAISRLLKYPVLDPPHGYDGRKFQENTDQLGGIDLDIFFYGMSADEAVAKIWEIHNHLFKEVGGEKIHYSISQYVLNIYYPIDKGWPGRNPQEIQMIFRLYQTKSEILHGFDLGSCAVGFDGEQVLFTSLSKFALEYGVNVIDTSRRSTSYEWRLSKYLLRGFGIVMPQLDLKSVKRVWQSNNRKVRRQEGEVEKKKFGFGYGYNHTYSYVSHQERNKRQFMKTTIGLPFAWLKILNKVGNRIEGDFLVRYTDSYQIQASDYGQNTKGHRIQTGLGFRYTYIPELNKQNCKYLMKGQVDRVRLYGENFEDVINYRLSLEPIMEVVQEAHGRLLRKLESLNLNETASSLATEIDIRKVQAAERVREMEGKIAWITKNPGSQLTSSINPIFDEEWKWYGVQFYRPNPDLRREVVIGSLLGQKAKIDDLMLFYSKDRDGLATKIVEEDEEIRQDYLLEEWMKKDRSPSPLGRRRYKPDPIELDEELLGTFINHGT